MLLVSNLFCLCASSRDLYGGKTYFLLYISVKSCVVVSFTNLVVGGTAETTEDGEATCVGWCGACAVGAAAADGSTLGGASMKP